MNAPKEIKNIPTANLINPLCFSLHISNFLEDFPTVTKEQALEALRLAKAALLHDLDETAA